MARPGRKIIQICVTDILNTSMFLGQLKDDSSFKESADIAAGHVYCHVKTDAKQNCSSKLFIKYSGTDLQHLVTRSATEEETKKGKGRRKEEVGRGK